jgi:hypothetical protein
VHVKLSVKVSTRNGNPLSFGQLLDNASAVYVHVRNTAAALRVPSQCRHTLAQILRVGKMEAISAAIARDNRGRAEKQLAVPLRRRGKERFEPSFSGYITTTDRDDQEDRASEDDETVLSNNLQALHRDAATGAQECGRTRTHHGKRAVPWVRVKIALKPDDKGLTLHRAIGSESRATSLHC